MATAAERQALLFITALAVIGGGVRVVGVQRFEREMRSAAGSSRAARDLPARALAAQIAAVDSAQEAAAFKRAHAPRKPASRGSSGGRRAPPVPGSERAREERAAAPLVINVNIATAAELERLPRIGPALAARILARRNTHGPFTSMEGLRHVSGIGPATARVLEPLVTFSGWHSPSQREDPPTRKRPSH